MRLEVDKYFFFFLRKFTKIGHLFNYPCERLRRALSGWRRGCGRRVSYRRGSGGDGGARRSTVGRSWRRGGAVRGRPVVLGCLVQSGLHDGRQARVCVPESGAASQHVETRKPDGRIGRGAAGQYGPHAS